LTVRGTCDGTTDSIFETACAAGVSSIHRDSVAAVFDGFGLNPEIRRFPSFWGLTDFRRITCPAVNKKPKKD
jgi:hypothetical protein